MLWFFFINFKFCYDKIYFYYRKQFRTFLFRQYMATKKNEKNEKNNDIDFVCKVCDYRCSFASDWERHILRAKHISLQKNEKKREKNEKNEPENESEFVCKVCDYRCSFASDWDRHILRAKHISHQKNEKKREKNENSESTSLYKCNCGCTYKHKSSFYKHVKKCDNTSELILSIIQQNQEFKDLLVEQNKQNYELQKQVLEQTMSMCEMSKNAGTVNNNNYVNNKTFNLQLFLNETCKDAMNIMDFVESIKFQISDLETVGELGYINGISNIIIRNLNALDENMRPVHCSDLKRDSIYVKDEDKWEKDTNDNKKFKNAIKFIAHNNVKMIPKYREKYPDCVYSDSRRSDPYNRMIIEAMGGKGDDDDAKASKIVKRIAKEILIDK